MTRRGVILLCALSVAGTAPASAQQISVRAGLGAPPKAEIALAAVAEPLSAPVKAGQDPLAVARAFCGLLSPTYLELLKTENGGGALATTDVDRSLTLPACFYMRPKGEALRAAGETLTEFSERVLGPSGPKTLQKLRTLNGDLETTASTATAAVTVPYSSVAVVYNLKADAANDPQAAVERLRDAFPGGQYTPVELTQVATADPGDLRPMNGIVKRQKVTCDRTVTPIAPEIWPVDVEAVKAALARNRAWRAANGLPPASALIAVADNGVDLVNKVFADSLLAPNPNEPKNNQDDDGNKKIDDIIGVSLYSDDQPDMAPADLMADSAHGTLMTSTALGGPKLTEVALMDGPTVRVLVIDMVQRRERPGGVTYGYPATGLAQAVDYAQYRGAHVVNFSVGTTDFQRDFDDVMLRPDPQRIIVAAAGNEALDYGVAPQYPAAYGGKIGTYAAQVVTVGAHDQWGCLADFSGRGDAAVDIVAPGVAFPATGPNGTVQTLDGTSQAAALTSYAIGQMKAEGLLGGARAKDRLYATAQRSSQLTPYVASGGRLDIAQAISVHHDILKTTGGPVEYGAFDRPLTLQAICPLISNSTGGDILRVDLTNAATTAFVLWRRSDGRRTTLGSCAPSTALADLSFTPDGGSRRPVPWTSVEYIVPH